MKKTHSSLVVLVLALLLGLLLAAGPASAVTPPESPSFTWYGGMAGDLDPGLTLPDFPAAGNETALNWRIYTWMRVDIPGTPAAQKWWTLYDWNYVAYDEPDGTQGIHYHWGTGIVTSKDPGKYWPLLPPQRFWLWTSTFGGITTPEGVHLISENWTGKNAYAGSTAYCTWRMADPSFQDITAQVWILE